MSYYEPPEPTARETFIEDYCIRFEESDECIERVRKANPQLSGDDLCDEVWRVAQSEAEEVWIDLQRELDEERAIDLN